MNLATATTTGSCSQVTVTWLAVPLPPDEPPPAGVLVPRGPVPPAPPVLAALA